MKQNIYYEAFHDKANSLKFFQTESDSPAPHFHRCIEILYMQSGKARCTVNDESFFAEKDDVVFVRKCAVHSYAPAPEYKDYVIVLGQKYSEDFSGIFQSKTLPALLSDKEFNRTLLPFFNGLQLHSNTASDLIAKGYINLIIGNLLQHYPKISVSVTPKLNMAVDVLNYIDEHYAEPISLDSLSSKFGYNKYYFSRLFNTYIGENLNTYINMVRVQNLVSEAKKEDKPNLSELIFAYGFDSMTTFYRSFSKFYDCPPTEIFKKD